MYKRSSRIKTSIQLRNYIKNKKTKSEKKKTIQRLRYYRVPSLKSRFKLKAERVRAEYLFRPRNIIKVETVA